MNNIFSIILEQDIYFLCESNQASIMFNWGSVSVWVLCSSYRETSFGKVSITNKLHEFSYDWKNSWIVATKN